MSRCRWSSMDWQCDLYVYDSDRGIEVHVAANRITHPVPTLPFILDVDIETWTAAYNTQMDALHHTERALIGGPFDGQSFTFHTEDDLAVFLGECRAAGYLFPDDLVDSGSSDRITAADVGLVIDGVPIRQAPDPGCYGCLGTGRLQWARVAPLPCLCVRHTEDCEPGSCVCPDDDAEVWGDPDGGDPDEDWEAHLA